MSIKNTVLLIEDEEYIARVIETVLRANGYRVITAHSGAIANSLIPSHIPDLVLLDLGLPDLDGIDILKSLRYWSDIPVIVISARDMDKDKVDALDLGADEYYQTFQHTRVAGADPGCPATQGNKALTKRFIHGWRLPYRFC